jgi:hypothetical protein
MSGIGIAPQAPTPVQWPAIIAGAICAAGISLTLHAFAAGVGLSLVSTAPTWRDASVWLVLVAGLYMLFVAICAYGFGGYVAGRMRTRLNASTEETDFRDGIDGLITWALAIVLAAVMAFGAAALATPAMAPSGGTQGATQSVAGENIIANELDGLFRTPNGFPDPYRRAEAARILLKASSHDGVPNADKDHLAGVVGRITGLPFEESMARVDLAVDRSAQALRKARVMGAIEAFFIGASLFMGAAIAWFAAREGGREREANAYPRWDWNWRGRSYPVRH